MLGHLLTLVTVTCLTASVMSAESISLQGNNSLIPAVRILPATSMSGLRQCALSGDLGRGFVASEPQSPSRPGAIGVVVSPTPIGNLAAPFMKFVYFTALGPALPSRIGRSQFNAILKTLFQPKGHINARREQ